MATSHGDPSLPQLRWQWILGGIAIGSKSRWFESIVRDVGGPLTDRLRINNDRSV